MYSEVTRNFRIEVEPTYIPEQSRPQSEYFFFAYRVKITNLGELAATLQSRHWIITDGTGVVREVRGEGVVGQQPTLGPGEYFEYSSFCPLPTPTGNLRGSYRMVDENEDEFEVKIPLFFLRDLRGIH